MQPYLILYQDSKAEWKTSKFWDYERFIENIRFMLTEPTNYKYVTAYRISKKDMP
jgi:hypothetical protein